jgi:hypothetical protein
LAESADGTAWDNASAATVRETIAQAQATPTNSNAEPGTYAFSTGKNIGLLQIIGPNRPAANTTYGVKIRYKLVQVSDFDWLKVEIEDAYMGRKENLEIKSDGSGTFGSGRIWGDNSGQGGPSREVKLQLTTDQMRSLRAALVQCQWLKAEPPIGPSIDHIPDYRFQLHQNGQTRQVKAMITANYYSANHYAQLVLLADSLATEARKRESEATNASAAQSEIPWGEPVEGVAVSLHVDKAVWRWGETPILHASLRNGNGTIFTTSRNDHYFQQVELDGKWFRPRKNLYELPSDQTRFVGEAGEMTEIHPGEQWNDVQIPLKGTEWQKASTNDLDLTAYFGEIIVTSDQPVPVMPLFVGKHTIRVAFIVQPEHGVYRDSAFRIISNPVELEIQSGLLQSK